MKIYTNNGTVIFSHNSMTKRQNLLEVLTHVSMNPDIQVFNVTIPSESVLSQLNNAVEFEVSQWLDTQDKEILPV